MLKLAAIVGPTGVGKTNISVKVAQSINGEILSCDSMQIYKGMDIGTAKINENEKMGVNHHLIDIVQPHENFTVADYQKKAKELIENINQKNKLPILVGGTGLYYQSVVDNYHFFPQKKQEAVRKKWEKKYYEKGLENLYLELKKNDPEYANKISTNDKKRIIRALEVFDITSKPFSHLQTRQGKTYNLKAIGLYLERKYLYEHIEQRVDKMISKGLIEEVSELRNKGYDTSLNSMQALGYKQVFSYLEGMITYDEMIKEIKKQTRRYAKRQLTWFKKDNRINWLNVQGYENNPKLLVEKIIKLIEGVSPRV
ncbi:tRNA dimethylallyltransferase [Candidatus Syntrophocurvum alkaliphilum]|uniref:tRNA dimethylallyltransferase n=1 Tax=Candidatus Syntrophocurvum alkaliphilum TaxID=2293317 RepID=A0A6I6DIV6_9FIRM|nr:tRNA (adenosine(37)-N6)-dimethylallyltransferase MiaA [Candidatus Syntrophocurvum alkaliphilum]QGT99431.1 tRNA dimethylallyltransferase [Candidatus Syntrophocurvum alkaliphilum]